MPPLPGLLIGWGLILALGLVDWAKRPRDAGAEARATPRWLWIALVVVGVLAVGVRAPLALTREARNVDEFQYAAAGAFSELPGESYLTLPQLGFRMHVGLYCLSGGAFAFVDVVTSLVVALTGLLLGVAAWRAWRRGGVAVCAAAFYPLGILRFEGLSSNAEPYANLFLAAYLAVVLGEGASGTSARKQLGRGALLGLAVLGKEHALPLIVLEPLRLLLPLLRAEGRSGHSGATLRSVGWAALGSAAPVLSLVACRLLFGDLGALSAESWTRAALPVADQGAASSLVRPLFAGYWRLVLGPVGLLGLVGLLSSLYRPRRLASAEHGSLLFLCCVAVLSLALVGVGLRFFGHYYQLAFPALALLGALQAADLAVSVRAQRAAVGPLLLLVAGATLSEVTSLQGQPRLAMGVRMHDEQSLAAVEEAARVVSELVPAGDTIYVWGGRPDLYSLARRTPASGWAVQYGFVNVERLLNDFRRHQLAALVVVPAVAEGEALERYPSLVEFLRSGGFRPGREVAGYVIWTR